MQTLGITLAHVNLFRCARTNQHTAVI